VEIVPNPNRTKISNIELIPLENKLEHFIILSFQREKNGFFEGADFGSKRPPSFQIKTRLFDFLLNIEEMVKNSVNRP
jgi:hypothetical protein